MANTLSSDLVPATVADMVVTVLQARLAPLAAFASDFSDAVVDPRRTAALKVPVAAATGSVLTNPTSFERQETTVNAADISVAHYSQPFGLSSEELNQGHRLERILKINLHALADKIIDIALAPVTTPNFGVATVSSDANFVSVGMPALWAALKNATGKVLVLDGSLYSKLLPTTKENFSLGELGAYGWDRGIYMNNRWTGAGANVKGFAASPEALAFASALPYMDSAVASLLSAQQNVLIPDLGLTVQFNVWGSTSSRAQYGSFDVVFGAGKADTSALKTIIYA